jgi:hypothetical protein
MIVLQIVNIEGHWLKLSNGNSIAAFENLDEAYKMFESFERMLAGDYQNHVSAAMGIMQLYPTIIAFDKPVEELKKYIIEEQVVTFNGGFSRVPGNYVKVTEEILELKVLDVTKQVMASAGIGVDKNETEK